MRARVSSPRGDVPSWLALQVALLGRHAAMELHGRGRGRGKGSGSLRGRESMGPRENDCPAPWPMRDECKYPCRPGDNSVDDPLAT